MRFGRLLQLLILLVSETCRALRFLIALRAISAQARFAPQEVVFATLTLRAALHYVRYSAALRSYSGFVEVPRSAPYPTECSSPLFPLVHHERIIVGVRPFRREILPADLFPFRRVVFREPGIPFHFRMDFGEIEPVRFR